MVGSSGCMILFRLRVYAPIHIFCYEKGIYGVQIGAFGIQFDKMLHEMQVVLFLMMAEVMFIFSVNSCQVT